MNVVTCDIITRILQKVNTQWKGYGVFSYENNHILEFTQVIFYIRFCL